MGVWEGLGVHDRVGSGRELGSVEKGLEGLGGVGGSGREV